MHRFVLSAIVLAGIVMSSGSPVHAQSAHRFRGNSCTFRSLFWGLNQATASFEAAAWDSLQTDYGQYPIPTGGSTPGPTQSQFAQASSDLQTVDTNVYGSNGQGSGNLVGLSLASASRFGMNNPAHGKLGVYKAAVVLVIGGELYLHKFIQEEENTPNSGYKDYRSAAQATSSAWSVLKQVPC